MISPWKPGTPPAILGFDLLTARLTLVPHVPSELLSLQTSSALYEERSGRHAADGVRELLLAASPKFFTELAEASTPDPWRFGFAILHTTENVVIGMCGFTGPPDRDGIAEIAYGIAPAYQGKGFASEAARALLQFATDSDRVNKVCAHTLAETNASTRILEKTSFQKVGELIDSENVRVWKWERTL